jgi:hypothetical protein
MTSKYQIDERVIQRAMEPYPEIAEIVPFSTPVVSFGDATKADVITIGINPSSEEFLTSGKNKKLLQGTKKRLVDTEMLEHSQLQRLTREEAIRVIEGCYSYFSSGKSYDWFKHLNEYANQIFQADYYDGTAAHVDLVQWATDPVWGKIRDAKTRDNLLKGDIEFLKYQVNQKKYKIVFLNGSKVFEVTTKNAVLEAAEFYSIPYVTKSGGPRSLKLFSGKTSAGSQVLGWSKPFPGHYISKEELPRVMAIAHKEFLDKI